MIRNQIYENNGMADKWNIGDQKRMMI